MDFLNRDFQKTSVLLQQQQILPATRIPFCAIERPVQAGESIVIEESTFICPAETTLFCPDSFDIKMDSEFVLGCEWTKDEEKPGSAPEPLCAPNEKRMVFKECGEKEIRTELCKEKVPCNIVDSNCVCEDPKNVIGVVCSPYIPKSVEDRVPELDCGLYGTNYKLACPEEYTLDEEQGLCILDVDKKEKARIKKNKIISGIVDEEKKEEEVKVDVIPLKQDVVVDGNILSDGETAPEIAPEVEEEVSDEGVAVTTEEEVSVPVEEEVSVPVEEEVSVPVEVPVTVEEEVSVPVEEEVPVPVEEEVTVPVEEEITLPTVEEEVSVEEEVVEENPVPLDVDRTFDGREFVAPELNLAVELERPMTKMDLRKSQFCPMDQYYSCPIPSL